MIINNFITILILVIYLAIVYITLNSKNQLGMIMITILTYLLIVYKKKVFQGFTGNIQKFTLGSQAADPASSASVTYTVELDGTNMIIKNPNGDNPNEPIEDDISFYRKDVGDNNPTINIQNLSGQAIRIFYLVRTGQQIQRNIIHTSNPSVDNGNIYDLKSIIEDELQNQQIRNPDNAIPQPLTFTINIDVVESNIEFIYRENFLCSTHDCTPGFERISNANEIEYLADAEQTCCILANNPSESFPNMYGSCNNKCNIENPTESNCPSDICAFTEEQNECTTKDICSEFTDQNECENNSGCFFDETYEGGPPCRTLVNQDCNVENPTVDNCPSEICNFREIPNKCEPALRGECKNDEMQVTEHANQEACVNEGHTWTPNDVCPEGDSVSQNACNRVECEFTPISGSQQNSQGTSQEQSEPEIANCSNFNCSPLRYRDNYETINCLGDSCSVSECCIIYEDTSNNETSTPSTSSSNTSSNQTSNNQNTNNQTSNNNNDVDERIRIKYEDPIPIRGDYFLLNNNISSYDGLCMNTGNKDSWRKSPDDLPLIDDEDLYTLQGHTSPLKPVISDYSSLYGPTIDGDDDSPNKLFLFSNNLSSPACCPSTFTTSTGCLCTSKKQRDFIVSRGKNVPTNYDDFN